MGTRSGFFKIVLYFALMLLAMSLMVLPFVSTSSPEFVIIMLTIAVNGVTAISTCLYLRIVSKKTDK